MITVVGFIAAGLTTFSFLPQALKTLKSKHTKDISLGMYAMFTTGIGLWLVYGLLLMDWPIILANIVTLALAGVILILKLKHG